MTNTVYVRPVYEDESIQGSEISEEPGDVAISKVKKGSCYRCLRGNRFTEKEVCIVCNAKYCIHCVLGAMGSMPEGRKCVTCIGFPIDESKRRVLGEGSRLLKRLFTEFEIRRIMEAEKLSEANQLQAEYVYVNGHQLCKDELISLQSCQNPPTNLKAGGYWYDNFSGLWGKEGQKPYKIISPHLNVGGPLMENASNGNTQVFINNREITKVELRMLQWAGVPCAGNSHFWVDEDGSYQEEAQQKHAKGNLWSKAGIKLVCAVLSLPVPHKAAIPSREQVNNSVSGAVLDYPKGMLQKLLLIGYNGSGTSTIFKQAKILYKSEPFSEAERQDIKLTIQSNLYRYLCILLKECKHFEKESQRMRKRLLSQSDVTGSPEDELDVKTIYSIGPRLKEFFNWLLNVMDSGNLEAIFPPAICEYGPFVEELWKDPAIQATFNQRSELQMLPSDASYFLVRMKVAFLYTFERNEVLLNKDPKFYDPKFCSTSTFIFDLKKMAVNISKTDYEPSNLDMLYAGGITLSNDLASIDFSFPQSSQDWRTDASNQHEPSLRYQLIRVNTPGLGDDYKWLEMFEDVGIAIFCVSLSDYDQFCDNGSNKMLANRMLFESIVTHPVFEEMDFLLILNKFDLLEEKIEQIPLTQCNWFYDFNPLPPYSVKELAQKAFYYMASKFMRLFASLTGRKLYVSMVNGLEADTVDKALRYAREILKWNEERDSFWESFWETDPYYIAAMTASRHDAYVY